MYRYLEAMMRLTTHRDAPGLLSALRMSLREFVHADRLSLFVLSNVNRDVEYNESNMQQAVMWDVFAEKATPMPLEGEPDLVQCVITRRPVAGESSTHSQRLVLPVLGTRGVMALLTMEGIRRIECEEKLLIKLLQIYGNQAYLLNRNDLDPLTGLYNRQSFDARIEQTVQAATRGPLDGRNRGQRLQSCFALLDIDHFKQVNDKYGHLFGDEMLLLSTRLLTRSFRHEDFLFRYGGEEFAVLLVGTGLDYAKQALERFRQLFAAYEFPQIGAKTVSIGVVGIDPGDTVANVVVRADKALYYAKNNGRNRVCCYEELVAAGSLESAAVATGDIELF